MTSLKRSLPAYNSITTGAALGNNSLSGAPSMYTYATRPQGLLAGRAVSLHQCTCVLSFVCLVYNGDGSRNVSVGRTKLSSNITLRSVLEAMPLASGVAAVLAAVVLPTRQREL